MTVGTLGAAAQAGAERQRPRRAPRPATGAGRAEELESKKKAPGEHALRGPESAGTPGGAGDVGPSEITHQAHWTKLRVDSRSPPFQANRDSNRGSEPERGLPDSRSWTLAGLGVGGEPYLAGNGNGGTPTPGFNQSIINQSRSVPRPVQRLPFIVAILVLLSSALHIDILLAIKLRYLHPKHLATRRTRHAAQRCRRCSR